MKEFDAIIIGSGQAGTPLATDLADSGYKVALIEKERVGGTCLNVGCTPTKAYVASARRAYVARNSDEHGVSTNGDVKINLQQIKKRKDEIIDPSRESIVEHLKDHEQISLFRGKAEFTGHYTLRVNEDELTTDRIFVNTGARPRIPESFASIPFLTNKTILELEKIPEHLIVVGGGPVGLEFSQIFRRFGSKVTIIDRADRLMRSEDEDVSEVIANILEDEGIDILSNSKGIKGKKEGEELIVSLEQEGDKREVRGSHVLLAAGRIPNTSELGLENTNIEKDEKGYIKVDDHCATSQEGVYAMGDCNGRGAFTHTSFNDYQIVRSHLFNDGNKKISDRFTCYALYIDPPFARVGLNERQVRDKGIDALMAKMPMDSIARAREKGETKGFLKVLVNKKTEEFLGASFLGINADEYIHTIIDQMYAGNSYKVVRDAVHIHPTVSELLPTLLQNLEPMEK